MAFYKITKTFMYSEEVLVEADSKTEAIDIAIQSGDSVRISDDHLYDCDGIEITKKQYDDER